MTAPGREGTVVEEEKETTSLVLYRLSTVLRGAVRLQLPLVVLGRLIRPGLHRACRARRSKLWQRSMEAARLLLRAILSHMRSRMEEERRRVRLSGVARGREQ